MAMVLRVAQTKSKSKVVIATVHREGTSSVALSTHMSLAMKQGSAVLYPFSWQEGRIVDCVLKINLKLHLPV